MTEWIDVPGGELVGPAPERCPVCGSTQLAEHDDETWECVTCGAGFEADGEIITPGFLAPTEVEVPEPAYD